MRDGGIICAFRPCGEPASVAGAWPAELGGRLEWYCQRHLDAVVRVHGVEPSRVKAKRARRTAARS